MFFASFVKNKDKTTTTKKHNTTKKKKNKQTKKTTAYNCCKTLFQKDQKLTLFI